MVKAVTQAVYDTLMQDMAVTATPRLIAEWEYNRFFAPTVTVDPDQTTTDADWLASYDTSSVTLPFRPTAGIARARSDSGVRPLNSAVRDPATTRFYPTPDVPLYSYFASIQKSELAPNTGGGYDFDAPIKVTAVYPETIAANKIVVGFETGYATPSSFSIQVSPDGTTWQTVFSNGTVAQDGTLTIWHSGEIGSGWGGTGWDVNPAYDSPVVIQGVRVIVYSMNAPYAHLDLLQISPRLENDLSDYLVTYDVDMSQDSPSFIAPLGKASSNTANLTLSNVDGRFNNDNVNSLYYKMIEKKVRFTMDLGINTATHGGDVEYVREFTMWADSWGAQNNSTIDVTLKDSSVILQEQTMPAIFLQNTTVGQVVWQTLDTIGMTNYQFTRKDTDYGQSLPFYWPSDTAEASNPRWGRLMVSQSTPPTTTIWDELSALCEATQTALYFDEHDVLQIKSREQMFDTGKIPDWNLDAVQNGTKLPDVVGTQSDFSLTTNQVEITYKPAAMAKDTHGFPKMEVVWQPTAPTSTAAIPATTDTTGATTELLRASALVKDLSSLGTDLWIHQPDALIWPYESDVNIESEIIHYKGKEYSYYDATGTLLTAVCQSDDDKATYDALNEFLSWKNSFTGRFIITGRAQYGSQGAGHYVKSNVSYENVLTALNHTGAKSITDYTTYHDGYITLTTPVTGKTANMNYLTRLRRNKQAVLPRAGGHTVYYGMKFRWPGPGQNVPDATSTANMRIGGLHLFGDDAGNGYYLDVSSTPEVAGWEQYRYRNELCLIALPASGNYFYVPMDPANTATKKGANVNVNEDEWLTLDVAFTDGGNGSNTTVTAYLNGVLAGTWSIPPSSRPAYTPKWRFGAYTRGPVWGLDIDYLYAIGQDDTNPLSDPSQSTYLDLITGGYQSKWVRRHIYYATGLTLPTQPSSVPVYPDPLDSQYFVYDEYGPVIHEVKKYDVQFSDQYVPVAGSYLYLTHPMADCISYYSDASGASFMLANASRNNVTINGDETDPVTGDNTTYSLSIYGRVIYTAQNDTTKIVKDDAAIRRQGLIRTQFTSRYIQTDDMATAIGNWITDLWATGVDQVTAQLFGNPLLQVGDLVTMNYPAKGMAPDTHQYYITSIKGSFDKGYSTEVTLRRAKIDTTAL